MMCLKEDSAMRAATDAPRAAIVRPPSDAFARAISSRGAATAPARARAQHAAYADALADLVEVVALPADEELPDACFVDDCAVVLGGRGLLTRPGARSRAAERERAPAAEAPPAPCFVDGCAVVPGGRALLTRPGARSRAAEPERLAGALAALVG